MIKFSIIKKKYVTHFIFRHIIGYIFISAVRQQCVTYVCRKKVSCYNRQTSLHIYIAWSASQNEPIVVNTRQPSVHSCIEQLPACVKRFFLLNIKIYFTINITNNKFVIHQYTNQL